ncbi:CDP-alcohol phosphatidyltransferase family protein [Aureivirga sp. CE67]|uniref:CDP-alcohol phosphatidyltransferase family protein n=1 Tax=Aureivirga sp. CE67 TaxID=1788983 RepID=UPI0018CA7353|nr:CDP-alcohol phosphatidyltransferase family protein [Aureivirga sp. CE67]
MKKHIPNLITLLNLLSGVIGVLFASIGQLEYAAYFVCLGIFFDFFDGFFARILNVSGELGKQLDSLADMVTSGVVPGIVMFQLLRRAIGEEDVVWFNNFSEMSYVPFFGLLIVLASCYRLANFNIDTRQSTSFIGLPTPANTLMVVSLPLILNYSSSAFFVELIQNKYVLIVITILGSYMMNAEIPLFSLKFKTFKLKDNLIKFIFLAITILLAIILKVVAIPLVIIVYILLSVVENMLKSKN